MEELTDCLTVCIVFCVETSVPWVFQDHQSIPEGKGEDVQVWHGEEVKRVQKQLSVTVREKKN